MATEGTWIGLFTAAAGSTIASTMTRVRTTGYRSVGRGSADYIYDPAVNSTFVSSNPKWAFLAADGRGFRLAEDQRIEFDMFGAYGDSDRTSGGGTDDYPSWTAAKAYLDRYKLAHGNPYYKSVPALYFGRRDYRFSQYLDLTDGAYSLIGAGPSVIDQGGNTGFVFDSGQAGIVLQSWDTTGITGTTTNSAKGSGGTLIQDIAAASRGGTVGAEQHGFLIKAPCILIRCFAYHFGGCGFIIAADVTHAGNANCGKIYDCGAEYNGRAGLASVGGDANAWEIHGFNAINNGTWGIEEKSFLGNHYYGYHTSGNASTSSGPYWATSRPGTTVHYNGHYYRVMPGQEVGASTNAPSGGSSNNTWWIYYGDGSANSTYPNWASGTTYVAGGAFLVVGDSNKSGVFGGYMEGDQATGLNLAGRAMMVCGGFSSFQGVSVLNAHDGRLWTPRLGTTQAGSAGVELLPNMIDFAGGPRFEMIGGRLWLTEAGGGTASMIRSTAGDQHPHALSFFNGLFVGNNFRKSASAMPTSGTYSRGAFIENESPSIAGGKVLLGWIRLTTGTSHALNTDWAACYATTS